MQFPSSTFCTLAALRWTRFIQRAFERAEQQGSADVLAESKKTVSRDLHPSLHAVVAHHVDPLGFAG